MVSELTGKKASASYNPKNRTLSISRGNKFNSENSIMLKVDDAAQVLFDELARAGTTAFNITIPEKDMGKYKFGNNFALQIGKNQLFVEGRYKDGNLNFVSKIETGPGFGNITKTKLVAIDILVMLKDYKKEVPQTTNLKKH
jgi:hypothetical protein